MWNGRADATTNRISQRVEVRFLSGRQTRELHNVSEVHRNNAVEGGVKGIGRGKKGKRGRTTFPRHLPAPYMLGCMVTIPKPRKASSYTTTESDTSAPTKVISLPG